MKKKCIECIVVRIKYLLCLLIMTQRLIHCPVVLLAGFLQLIIIKMLKKNLQLIQNGAMRLPLAMHKINNTDYFRLGLQTPQIEPHHILMMA